ncbi:MAG: SNF2-related protein, partial [Eubacteriales bacterium]|nr:SNF2-related protein [Eubacteriales bacterium]
MKYIPHDYQRYCEERIIQEPSIGLFLEMGLGKTVITLSAIQRLKYDLFQVCRCLVIAPKKVAESTWTAEARKWDHLSVLRVQPVLGSVREREAALSTPADVYVLGRDNVAWIAETLRPAWPFDMVVLDELSSFKNASAKRFRALKAMLPRIRRVVGLTGTPAPNGIVDLWAQIYLLDRGQRLGRTLTWYRQQYFTFNPYTHEYKPLAGSRESIFQAISDLCVSLKAEDYLKMPELMVHDIPVALDAQQRLKYQIFERDMFLHHTQGEVTASNAAVLTGKLLQYCAGAVYQDNARFDGTPEDKRFFEIHHHKLDALSELVEALQGEHALLFYGYQHDVPRILARLKKVDLRLRVRKYEGPEDADAWNAGEVDILLAHPAS